MPSSLVAGNRHLMLQLHGCNLWHLQFWLKWVNISCTSGPVHGRSIVLRLCVVSAAVVSPTIRPFPSGYSSNEFNHLVHRGPIVGGSEKKTKSR